MHDGPKVSCTSLLYEGSIDRHPALHFVSQPSYTFKMIEWRCSHELNIHAGFYSAPFEIIRVRGPRAPEAQILSHVYSVCAYKFHAINVPQLSSILHNHGTPFRAIWSVMELVKLHRRPRILPLAQLLRSPQTYPGLCRNDGLPAAVTRDPPCFKFLNLSTLVSGPWPRPR